MATQPGARGTLPSAGESVSLAALMPEMLRLSDLAAFVWSQEAAPAVMVTLEGEGCDSIALPDCPVIGIGDAAHPLAARLDAVVPEAALAEDLARNCALNPRAASVLVQLLRMIEGLPVMQALVAESIAYGLLQAGAEHRAWRARQQASPRAVQAEDGRLVVERRNDVLLLEIDRPAARNAIDRPLRDALREAFEVAAMDQDIGRIVLRARGRTFSTGADLGEFGTTLDPAEAHAIRMRTLPAPAIARCASRLEARIEGACIGAGLEMAAFAARIVASEKAWFQLPELAMGLIPGAGGCVSMSRRIGRQRTAQMVLSGRRIGLEQALGWGLVDVIV